MSTNPAMSEGPSKCVCGGVHVGVVVVAGRSVCGECVGAGVRCRGLP